MASYKFSRQLAAGELRGTDELARALSRQRFFIPTSPNRDRFESQSPRVLNTEMSQSADAVYSDDVAAPSAGMTQRVVHRDSGAHERPGFFRRQVFGNRGEGC